MFPKIHHDLVSNMRSRFRIKIGKSKMSRKVEREVECFQIEHERGPKMETDNLKQ